jgi:DNA-binding transcriptional MerR regulator
MAVGNRARQVLNGFSAADVSSITGLSLHTINYLAREGYLSPTYTKGHVRGKVRYYSYRDLVVARVIQKLVTAGVELKRLKRAIKLLSHDDTWKKNSGNFHLLATDGRKIFFHMKNGSLLDLSSNLQHSFAFVLDISRTSLETRRLIEDQKKRRNFVLQNLPLEFKGTSAKARGSQ